MVSTGGRAGREGICLAALHSPPLGFGVKKMVQKLRGTAVPKVKKAPYLPRCAMERIPKKHVHAYI